MASSKRIFSSHEIRATDLILLNLPNRALNPLLRARIFTVGQVNDLGVQGLLAIKNVGMELAKLITAEVDRYCLDPHAFLENKESGNNTFQSASDVPKEILELPIESLGISNKRTVHTLKRNSIVTVRDLLQGRRSRWIKVIGLSPTRIASVEKELEAFINGKNDKSVPP